MSRPGMWMSIVLTLCVLAVSCGRANAVDEKQFTLLLENNKWLRDRLDKTEKEHKDLQAEHGRLKETLKKAMDANHRMAVHIRGESTAATKPGTPGTTPKPGTTKTDTDVNTNVKIIDLSLLSPRVETKTEAKDDEKTPTKTDKEGKTTDTDVNTNVSIFDLSLLSPRVKTDTKTTTANQATIKALQDAVVLRDKLIVERNRTIAKRDVEIVRLRTLLLQKGINPDAR